MTLHAAVVGATGAVGQRLVQLLASHPTFEVVTVTASSDSAGQRYDAAANWYLGTPIPEGVADRRIRETDVAAIPDDVDIVFSSLPSAVGQELEPALCAAGHVVSSNSSNARTDEDVPLTIPELNPDHLGVLERQRQRRGWDGALVKNPNCSTITMAPPLAALDRAVGVERVTVATLQAVSGAGYDGVSSMEIMDNAIPHIGGEKRKMETESRKLLGAFDGTDVTWHEARVDASCNRIPTLEGHLESVWVDTDQPVTATEATRLMETLETPTLHSSPDQLIHVLEASNRPQPRLDSGRADGMAVVVGGVEETDGGVQFDCLAHNTVRGAAGASVLNGELLVDNGYV
jgi:aspartate semialdehyde dehydrogenase (EC 1.2.1.11)